jgi:hypothetical protein
MEINLKNIEELIFFDKKIQQVLPEFKHFFDQWLIGKKVPGLAEMSTKSVLGLLEAIQEDHIRKLEEYFDQKILVVKINTNLVKNVSLDLDENLCGFIEYKDFCAYRNKDELFLSFWR